MNNGHDHFDTCLACGMYLETVTVTLVRCNNMRALLDCNKIC